MQQAMVPFHGNMIPTVEIDGEVMVAMKPVAEAIGIGWQGQHDRLRRHPVLASTIRVTRMVGIDGRSRNHVVLPIAFLNGWLFTVSAERARPEVRQRLIEYQRECFLVLDAYWRRGVVVNPRVRSIVETQHPHDGVAKTQGQRFAEERLRFEAREGVTLQSALLGMRIASPAAIRAIERDVCVAKEKLLVMVTRFGFDINYVLYGKRMLTDAERAIRDAYRLTDEAHRQMMIEQAERMPIDPPALLH